MKRSDFIKSLVGVYGLAHIEKIEIKHYEKVYLKHFYLRGFTYYEGPKMIDEINKSGMVELIREPKNEYDSRAIALNFNKNKIGYVPRESNKTISILMDTELLEFHAEITEIDSEACDWEKIRVAIYALKEIKQEADYKKIESYNKLTSSKSISFKYDEDYIIRLTTYPSEEYLLDNNSKSA